MPQWIVDLLGDITLVQVVLWVALVVLLIVGIVKLWPLIRNLVGLVDSLGELPAFIETTRAQIADIHHETHTNKGTSIKDAVKRLETGQKRVEKGVAGLYGKVDELDRKTTAEDERLRKEIEDTRPHPHTGVPKPKGRP